MWFALFIILTLILLGYIVFVFRRERKELDKRTVETMGDELFREIEEERETEIRKGKKFRKVLTEMKKKK